MKLSEIQLDELSVFSSWIADLDYKNGDVIMILDSGRKYRVMGVPEGMFRQWVRSPSKGKHWHGYIKGHYRVSRV
jgi:hypothetical protein